MSGVDLVSKFDALNARFKAEYELFQVLNLECRKLMEDFKRCHFWQFWKQEKLSAAMYECWRRSAERIARMTEIHAEMESTRKDMQELLAAVRRDQMNMQ